MLLAFAGALLIAAVRLIRIRLRARREENRELPPLIYPGRRVDEPGVGMTRGAARSPADDHVMFDSSGPAVPPVHIVREHPEVPAVSDPEEGVPASEAGTSEADGAENPDVTLQLLPGRLEPVGRGKDHEIRFVRLPGLNRFTFGRSAGPAHSHIQLRAETASRMHAFMEFESGRWQLGNMSRTNAVVVNGSPLNGEGPHQLNDGDRIEFGELTYIFRER